MAYGQMTSTMMTSGSGVISILFEITANDVGEFTIAGVKGDAGIIKNIITPGGAPPGVFSVELRMKVIRFLYAHGQMLHSSSVPGDLYMGPNAPRGFDENDRNAGALQIFAYVEGGVNAAPAPGTVFLCCLDVQTENWGTR